MANNKKQPAKAKVQTINPKVAEASEKWSDAYRNLELAIGNLANLKKSGASLLDIEIAEQEANKALASVNDATEEEFYTTSAYSESPIHEFLRDPYITRYALKSTKDSYFGETLNVTSKKVKASLGTLATYVEAAGKQFSANPRWQRSFGNAYAILVARRALLFGVESVTMDLPSQVITAAKWYMNTPERCTYANAADMIREIVSAIMGDEVAENVGEPEPAYIDACLTSAGNQFCDIKFKDHVKLADELTSILLKVSGYRTNYNFS